MTAIEHAELGVASSPLIFTDAAAAKARQLIQEQDNPRLNLRVYIEGGGCSGFQYGFNFDDVISDDDTVVEHDGVKLLVDGASVQFLHGAEIDYVEELTGSQFVIKNPNARTSCGCGSSFEPA